MSFVIMRPPAQDDDRCFAEMTEIQFARVTTDGGFWKAGDSGIGNFFGRAQLRQRVMKSAAKNDGERRSQRRKLLQPRGGGFGINVIRHGGMTLTDSAEKFNALPSLCARSKNSLASQPEKCRLASQFYDKQRKPDFIF